MLFFILQGQKTERDYLLGLREALKLRSVSFYFYPESVQPDEMVRLVRKNYHQIFNAKGIAANLIDNVWLVFDKDEFKPDSFNQAASVHNQPLSKQNQTTLKVAYSNQCFEYWLLLHFDGHNGAGMHRKVIKQKLYRHLQGCLDKSKPKALPLKALNELLGADPKQLVPRYQLAAQRAASIYKQHQQEGTPPALAESSTTMHLLLADLGVTPQ